MSIATPTPRLASPASRITPVFPVARGSWPLPVAPWVAATVASIALVGCGGAPPAPPKDEAPKADACPLSLEKLDGTTWLWLRPQPSGPDKQQPQTRMHFRTEGGVLKSAYTASSLSQVYDYTCATQGKIMTCIEDDVHAKEWSRAWGATHDGKIDTAALSAATGIPAAEFDKVNKEIVKELAGLKGDERTETFKTYNSPNNKIRGKFMVAVDKAKCMLTVQDKYIAMVDSRPNEYENPVGTAKFEQSTEPYTFAACLDVESANTIVADGATAHTYPPGTYEFTSTLKLGERPDPACTYSANIWKDWLPLTPNLAPDDAKKVKWSIKVPLDQKGPHVISFERSKTCGAAAPVSEGVSCAKLHIE